ncbi:MAG: methylmalonyl-CoA epimerase [Candidatus Nanopelagicaceae bacterium]|nr:methylmalonyl-CoA epimerase [Candidatus Nanopelagicaceae bacterium]
MKFRQIGLYVSNLDRAVDFYSNLLKTDTTARFDSQGFAFFDLDGVRLFLDVNAPKSAIYLEFPDLQSKVEELRLEGIKIISEAHVVFPDPDGIFDLPGNEWLAFIEDSEGNLVGLMSRETL